MKRYVCVYCTLYVLQLAVTIEMTPIYYGIVYGNQPNKQTNTKTNHLFEIGLIAFIFASKFLIGQLTARDSLLNCSLQSDFN